MRKALETTAATFQPYLFFDDIGGGIFSNPLNRFITSMSHTGRVMGGNREVFYAPNVTQVLATGNDIRISTDLMRRSLIAELFLPGDVRGRRYERVITMRYLRREEVRKGFLAALCALVRHYLEWLAGFAERGETPPEIPVLETFEDWTGTISAIMQVGGYNDPLISPDLATGGAEDDDEMKELLVKVATAAEADAVFDRKALVEKARELGLLEPLVGLTGEKDLDSNSMKKFGRQLQRHRGREYRDERGRRFRFAHRRQKRGATYPLTFIS